MSEFPKGFVWGAATSSYQIEGAATQDGRGQSVWDAFSHTAGKIADGTHGDDACDHYNQWSEDVDLLRRLGANAYRLSIAWPRIVPEGTGAVNERGLSFYDELVDGLLEVGVEPWVTLFHWDYPQELLHRGGWLNRESADWFAEYAQVVVDRLSDRVSNWITLNEPQCFIGLGHGTGTHAPGLRLNLQDLLLITHHVLLAHGRAVQVIRTRAKTPPRVGWASVGHVNYPETDNPADIEAARDATFSIPETWTWNMAWYADPICRGYYPEAGLRRFGHAAVRPRPGDMQTIHQPTDFFGLNIYAGEPISLGAEGQVRPVKRVDGHAHTAMGWPVAPESLYWGPRFIAERYELPVYITENGMANLDWVNTDGRVHDPQRIDYTRRYLAELRRAVQDGVDVRGYFHWSLLDNFEWAEGFRKRFGLVHVDFATKQRVPKDSFEWYRNVIATNGAAIDVAQAETAS
jgi:beta-glucosidase